jgi:hypothetical protein
LAEGFDRRAPRNPLSIEDDQQDNELDNFPRGQDQALPLLPAAVREFVGGRAGLAQVQIDDDMALGLREPAFMRRSSRERDISTKPSIAGNVPAANITLGPTLQEASHLTTNRRNQTHYRQKRTHSQQARSGRTTSANWRQLRDQYLARAKTASDAGDAIAAENFLQHADHYLRLIQGAAA